MFKKLFCAVPIITSNITTASMRQAAQDMGFSPIFNTEISRNPVNYLRAAYHFMLQTHAFVSKKTSFLGAEADPDVIFLLGMAAALRKPVFQFSNESLSFYQRVRAWNGKTFTADEFVGASKQKTILYRDRDGMRIENMGIREPDIQCEDPGQDNYTNLMLEGPLLASGTVFQTPTQLIPEEALYTDISVFLQTLAYIQERWDSICVEPYPSLKPNPNPNSNHAYLAGPDVFLPNLDAHFHAKKEITKAYGIIGQAPIDAQLDFAQMQSWALPNGNNPRMRAEIYKADVRTMLSSDMGIFQLTPHHGVSADSGTIFELGFMTTRAMMSGKKPKIFAYSNGTCSLPMRIDRWKKNPSGPMYYDPKTDPVACYNSFGPLIYSPLIDAAIRVSGGHPTHHLGHDRNLLLRDGPEKYNVLGAFKSCVQAIKMNHQPASVIPFSTFVPTYMPKSSQRSSVKISID